MKISEICIKRPVLATVINLIIILIGLICFTRLTLREYPNIDVPIVSIETTLPGADPALVESQVTVPLEESLSGIEGVNYMTSHSRPESSEISIYFMLNVDPNIAIANVRDRVGTVRDKLPKDIKEPVISKVESNAEPIIWLAFSADKYSPLEVTELANKLIKDRIQTIPGVAQVTIFGARKYSMRIWLYPKHLAAYHLTPIDVENAIKAQNIEVPAGRIESDTREFTVLTSTDLNTPKQFENIILKNVNGYLVHLKDVAKVEEAARDTRQIARYNGKEAIALGIVKQSTANPLDISNKIKAILPALQASLPKGVQMEFAYDTATYIKQSIISVFETIFVAILLVVGVIFLFLKSVRATLIPLVTIPVSLIGACSLMYLFGFSINTLTLLAFVLAIGLVVDDSIVVLENIYRHMERGIDKVKAAILGISEIGFAVVAMTLTLVFVFTPIAFARGETGKLFIEFALTLASAVVISGFAALTLSPMMASRMLRASDTHGKSYFNIEEKLRKLTEKYQSILRYCLEHNSIIILLAIAACFISVLLFLNIKSELAPTEDKGNFLIMASGPQGSSLKYTDSYIKDIEDYLNKIPEVESHFSAVGFPIVSRAISFVNLKPWSDRSIKQQKIVESLGPLLYYNISGLLAFPINPPSIGQGEISRPIEVVLQTTASYQELKKTLDQIIAQLKSSGIVENIDSDLQLNTPQLKVKVRRNKVAAIGSSVEEVTRVIESLISGKQITRYKKGSEQYDVVLQATEDERILPQNIYSYYIRAKNGEMIPLSNVVELIETVSAAELNHFNKLRSTTITATLGKNVSLNQAIQYIEGVVFDIAPSNFQIDYAGVTREFKESQHTMLLVFVLALSFIYLVLAAQFESFIDPFIILISVPLALVGALLALKLSGGTLNIYSQIGLITLIGLITKHGILIVEFSNQLRHQGQPTINAIIQAATLRLRPILMTTSAMILGALPLALSSGAGSESRQDLGWVIVGGLLVGTAFTLFVVPVIYSLFAFKKEDLKHSHLEMGVLQGPES